MATGGENSDCKIQESRPRKNKHTFFYAATVARSIKQEEESFRQMLLHRPKTILDRNAIRYVDHIFGVGIN